MPRSIVGVIATHRLLDDRYPIQGAGEHNLEAVMEVANAQPLLIPSRPRPFDIASLLEVLDGVLLTGGRANVHPSEFGAEPTPAYEPYDQDRDAVALDLTRACVEAAKPIFGICRGIQEMNVAFGGTLHPEIRELPGRMNHRMPKDEPNLDVIFKIKHGVHLIPDGAFARILGAEEIQVNSLHGQGIEEPGDRVVIEGVADDGTPEAISIKGATGFALGVQWHAEYKASENDVNRRLFEAFGAAMRGEH